MGDALAGGCIGGGDGVAVVEIEAAVAPCEEVVRELGLEVAEARHASDEGMAEEFCKGREGGLCGEVVEVACGVEESVGGEDVDVWVVVEGVAECLACDDESCASVGEIQAVAKPLEVGIAGCGIKELETFGAVAEGGAEDFGNGEDVLAVRDGAGDSRGDEGAFDLNFLLVAGRA